MVEKHTMRTEDEIILAMCKAHDHEDAAQRGEPSPWDAANDGVGPEDDGDFAAMRFLAMREAYDVAAEHFTAQNATLAAEKAELVEALEAVARWVEARPDEHPFDTWEKVRKALSRAKGDKA